MFNPFLKEGFKLLGWVLLFLLLWFNGCSSKKQDSTVKVTTKEIKSEFPKQVPTNTKIINEKKDRNFFNKNEKEEVKIDNKIVEENLKLKEEYLKETNPAIKDTLFSKVVSLNKFSSNFEDENITININGIVQGEVKEITPYYTIKKKNIDIPLKQKETVLRVLVGGSLGINKELNQFSYKTDIGFQNAKGDILEINYLQVGSEKFGMIGYKKSIFNFKR